MTYSSKPNYVSKLTLGTAQLGINYGIANQTGMPTKENIFKIIDYAISHGIDSLDTAPGYGECETLIGEYIHSQKFVKNSNFPFIITKMPSVHLLDHLTSHERCKFMKQNISNSQNRLQLTQIEACLLHDPLDMTASRGEIVQHLLQLKKEGSIKKIGVSVYEPKEVEIAIQLGCFDIIQVPINLLDQRLVHTNLLKKLYESDIEIYGRSIYLQGLLLMSPDNLPEHLKSAKIPLEILANKANDEGLSVAELALLYVRDIPELKKIIIGCETIAQVKQNLHMINLPPLSKSAVREIQDLFQGLPQRLIDPRMWS